MKRIKFKSVAVAGFLALALQGIVQAAEFNIDPNHSSVSFLVKHVVGKVSGHFEKFSGTFAYAEGNPETWSAMATIEAASVNTGIEKRNNHLRSPDFFDVQKFPTLSFKSTGVTDVQGDKAKLRGDLTMHGVTKSVVLDLDFAGVAKDPMGKGTRAGASATGHVNRLDFGIGPASGPMAGMVGNDVAIDIEIEGVSQ